MNAPQAQGGKRGRGDGERDSSLVAVGSPSHPSPHLISDALPSVGGAAARAQNSVGPVRLPARNRQMGKKKTLQGSHVGGFVCVSGFSRFVLRLTCNFDWSSSGVLCGSRLVADVQRRGGIDLGEAAHSTPCAWAPPSWLRRRATPSGPPRASPRRTACAPPPRWRRGRRARPATRA